MTEPTPDQHHRLYEIWKGFCRRCHLSTRRDYPHYGGRGIKVCEQWRGSAIKDDWCYDGFLVFEQWALTHGYKDGMTIDRINNNKGYEPGNVRWISKKAQAYNRSTNVYYTYKGRTLTAKQWSD